MIDFSNHGKKRAISLLTILSSVSVQSLILIPASGCKRMNRVSFPTTGNVFRPTPLFSSTGDDTKHSQDSVVSPSSQWLSMENINILSEQARIPVPTIIDWYTDVTVFVPESTGENILPSYVRLRSSAPLELFSTALQLGFLHSVQSAESDQPILPFAQFVASSTLRWCHYFVAAQDLNLCPWAKGSLTTEGAVRIKILLIPPRDPKAEIKFEQLIRSSAHELVRVTQTSDPLPTLSAHSNTCTHHETNDVHLMNRQGVNSPGAIEDHRTLNCNHYFKSPPASVDSNSAITFVVAAPINNASRDVNLSYQDTKSIFCFNNFYDFATDLEDRFLDEDDIIQEQRLQQEQQEPDSSIYPQKSSTLVEDVTIAPFHPVWEFAQDNLEIDEENPVNYEKRSPFPTISLVRTKAIVKAGEDATERIAEHNEQVLNHLGSKVLNDIYKERVWGTINH